MSYANNITHKCQLAAKAMLQAAVVAETLTLIPSASIFSGICGDDTALPRIVCVCKQAQVEEIFDGNWSADLSVQVMASAADTTESAFHDLCSEVWAHFFLDRDDVHENLSNASIEFTAHEVYPRTQSWELFADEADTSGTWQGELTLTVKCCGSVIT